ncbi:DEAD/DEAH box helicase family protein, partial [Streptomyces sp. NPDC001781]
MSPASQTLQLRPYQREAIDAVQAAWADGMQRPAVVLATGMGKTVVFSRMAAEHIAEHGTRVVILVHRDELADQTLDKLKQTEPDLFTGKVKAASDGITA